MVSINGFTQSIDELNSQLNELKKGKDYKNALLLADKIKMEILKIYGNQKKEYAVAINNLGELYSTTGDYKKAELNFLQALVIYKKLNGTEDSYYAVFLNNLGTLYSDIKEYKKAEPLFLKSLVILKKEFGAEHPLYAVFLNLLGLLYNNMKDYKKAESYYLEALAIRNKVLKLEDPDYATSLDNIGSLYYTIGNYKKAEPFFLLTMNIYKKILGTENPDYANSLNNLGQLYSSMGDYKKTEAYYLEALAIRKRILGAEHPDYATSLSNLSVLYSDMGDYKKAESYSLEALAIRKKVLGIEHPDYASSLNNLGVLYSTVGDIKKAETYNLEALIIRKKVLGSENLDYARSLNNIGYLFFTVKDYKRAESYYFEAMTIYKKILGTEHPDYATFLNNMGVLYSDMGDYKKAEFYFLEALTIRKKVLGAEHPNYALSLNNLGMHYNNMGDNEKAEAFYLQACAIYKKILGIEHPIYANSLNNLGTFYYLIKKLPQSFEYLHQALVINNKNIKRTFDFLTEQEELGYLKTFSYNFDIYFSLFFTYFPYHLVETSTLFNNELQNKRLVLRNSQQIKNAVLNSNDTNLIRIWNQILVIKKKLSKIYSLPKDKYPDNVQSFEEEVENLDKQMVNHSQEYRHLHEQLQTENKAVQQFLKPNNAVIEFVSFLYLSPHGWTDSILYAALVLRPGFTHPKFVFLFEEKQLSDILKKDERELDQAYINNLYKTKDGNNRLSQLIWQPLDSLLQGVTTLYAAPSGLLHKIALGAIPINDSSTVSSKYGLQILGTTGDIVNKKEDFIDKKSVDEAILFGGINYDIASTKPLDFKSSAENKVYAFVPKDSTRGANGKWNYLGGSMNEAQLITKEFTAQKIITHFYSDSTATETLFKNMPVSSNSIIHIATHGYFFPDLKRKKEDNMMMINEEKQTAFKASENPLLRSGLIFAGANPAWTNPDYVSTATDDGILTAYEISNMDLSNVKLVVLSACETGLGDIKASEGVFGLQRSFKLAGVKNIIMSLWKVPDEKTRELMQTFYQFCFTGKSVSDAFRAAQETMRIKYPNSPYYWAGFTLLQ